MAIRVSRERAFMACLRRVQIEVDDVEVARLWPGQHVDIQGTGSEQDVRARLDWTTSELVNVRDPGNSAVVNVVVSIPSGARYLVRGLWTPAKALAIRIE